jgi:hypothetical protein
MTKVWEKFEDFGNQASAEALAGRLRLEGVPAQIERISPLPGLNEGFRVMVSERLAHRARWILASIDTTESDLAYLATGKLLGDDDSQVDNIVSKRFPFFGIDHFLGLLAGAFLGASIGMFVLGLPAGLIVGGVVGGIFGEFLGLIVGYLRYRFRRL